jgi:hypothetical protein
MSNNLIYKKMSDVMKEIGPVTKDQKNAQQGFKFRGIDQFVNALHPALVKNGVFMAPRAVRFDQEIKDVIRASSGKPGVDKHVSIMMEYDFYAEDGSKVTVGPIPAEGLDSGDKATNKALSAALKYALIQTFSVPTEDMAEADLESPEIATTARAAAVAAKTTKVNVTTAVTGNTDTSLTTAAASPKVAEVPKTSSFRNRTTAKLAEVSKAATAPVPVTSDGDWV